MGQVEGPRIRTKPASSIKERKEKKAQKRKKGGKEKREKEQRNLSVLFNL